MYESLRRYSSRPIILWILCFEEQSLRLLEELELPDVRLISQERFEEGDIPLKQAKENRSKVEFFWSCTPSLMLFVLNQDPDIECITYVDADLFFYSDPQPIYEEFASGSILVHEHRFSKDYLYRIELSGKYNVGLIIIRRDSEGLACLERWRTQCIEWCYARHEDGKFGDQLYLDEWTNRYSGVVILQNIGAGAAPWNINNYRISIKEGNVRLDNQSLIFFHFHAFKFVSSNLFSAKHPISLTGLKEIYFPYISTLREISKVYSVQLKDPGHPLRLKNFLMGLLNQRLFIYKPKPVSYLLWTIGAATKRLGNLCLTLVGFFYARAE